MWSAVIVALLASVIFVAGTLHARNRIMRNMMVDLVEVEDMNKWLRIWS